MSASPAPTLPTAAGVGDAWIPYALAAVAVVALGVVALVRTRRRSARGDLPGLVEFLLVRGAVLAVLVVAVALLADAAAEGDGLTGIDLPGWRWLVEHRTDALTSAARTISTVGSTATMGILAVVAVALLGWRRRRLPDAALVAAVAGGAAALVTFAKPIVGRVRPPAQFRLVDETNQSFPSGHATASIAVIGVLVVVVLPLLAGALQRALVVVVAVVAVAAIGLSRLYLGVHWPTDILGGWLSGGTWLLVCVVARQAWQRYPSVSDRGLRITRALPGVRTRVGAHPATGR